MWIPPNAALLLFFVVLIFVFFIVFLFICFAYFLRLRGVGVGRGCLGGVSVFGSGRLVGLWVGCSVAMLGAARGRSGGGRGGGGGWWVGGVLGYGGFVLVWGWRFSGGDCGVRGSGVHVLVGVDTMGLREGGG
jgi:hypothetical protein